MRTFSGLYYKGVLLVLSYCLQGPINSYLSFLKSILILCLHNADTLNICMKDFGSLKRIIDKMITMTTLTFFQACLNKKVLCLFYDSAYMGRSAPTTAFDGAI